MERHNDHGYDYDHRIDWYQQLAKFDLSSTSWPGHGSQRQDYIKQTTSWAALSLSLCLLGFYLKQEQLFV